MLLGLTMNIFEISLVVCVYASMTEQLIQSIRRKEWGGVKFQLFKLVIVSLILAGMYAISR